MLTNEDKFQKVLNLYTKVIDAGLTWGINDEDEMVKHKIAIGKRNAKNIKWYEKYINRQTAIIYNQNKEFKFTMNKLEIGQTHTHEKGVNNEYKYVKNGSRPKNNLQLKLKKVEH